MQSCIWKGVFIYSLTRLSEAYQCYFFNWFVIISHSLLHTMLMIHYCCFALVKHLRFFHNVFLEQKHSFDGLLICVRLVSKYSWYLKTVLINILFFVTGLSHVNFSTLQISKYNRWNLYWTCTGATHHSRSIVTVYRNRWTQDCYRVLSTCRFIWLIHASYIAYRWHLRNMWRNQQIQRYVLIVLITFQK